jgi:DNA-binding HxlR family transcriptional regulator
MCISSMGLPGKAPDTLASNFHCDGKVRRFSELERQVTGISQKLLAQQLRQLEACCRFCRIHKLTVPCMRAK